jgi:hypothetical protein
MRLDFILQLFTVALLLNVVWEFGHSRLYTTCLKQRWTKNIPLLTKMAIKDAFFIVLFYTITAYVFNNFEIWKNIYHTAGFAFLSLAFSYSDELISTKAGRWHYAPSMPRFMGVGVTPLLEVAATGLIAFGLLNYF